MRKYALGILILAVTLLLSGQEGCDRGGDVSTEGPYVGGTEGLVISFLDDAPPATGNFQGEDFNLEVELTNYGEDEVVAQTAGVSLIGAITGPSFTKTLPTGAQSGQTQFSNSGAILGITDKDDVADSDFVDLGKAKLSDASGVSYSPLVKAQVCYPYRTFVQVDNLCIPGDNRESNPECSIDSAANLVDAGDVSAGPIQITSVIESRTADGIRVRLDIENKGNGIVFNQQKSCADASGVIDSDDKIVVVEVLGGTGWTCNYKDATLKTVELRDGVGRLRCNKDIGGTGRAYIDRFIATISYKYVDTTSKSITIQK